MVFLQFLWFIIGLKWRIKAWGHIPILFRAFGKLSIFSPDLDPSTPYLLPKYFKNARSSQIIFKKEYFYISQHFGNPPFSKVGEV